MENKDLTNTPNEYKRGFQDGEAYIKNKIVKELELFISNNTKIYSLREEMNSYARVQKYEKASELKKEIEKLERQTPPLKVIKELYDNLK